VGEKSHDEPLGYVAENADRMGYPAYRPRVVQTSSGPMESLHRAGGHGAEDMKTGREHPMHSQEM
jgi:hypothetical protein